jgi:hypothetical protein
MVRIAAFSDVHGNLPALEAVRKAVDAARPDYVAICGDLVFNGPDPAGTLALIQELEKAGAFVTLGNTDLAVADGDFTRRVPVVHGRRPGLVRRCGRVGPRPDRRRRHRLPAPPPVRAPAARRRRPGPLLPRLARVADRRARRGPRSGRHHRSGQRNRREGHRLRPHPPARGPRGRLADDRQRRQRRLRLRRRSRRPAGP